MALDTTNRARVSAQYQREGLCPGSITKAQLAAAITATDDWIEANQAAFNATLPAAFRTAATAQQKTDLFCFVAQRRAGRLRVQED